MMTLIATVPGKLLTHFVEVICIVTSQSVAWSDEACPAYAASRTSPLSISRPTVVVITGCVTAL